MKYLKTYEQKTNKSKFYWLVKTKKPYFEAALYKFNLSNEKIDMWLKNDNVTEEEKIYIVPYCITHEMGWTHSNRYGRAWFEKNKYIYKGELEITLEDIENMKIKRDVNKYNL